MIGAKPQVRTTDGVIGVSGRAIIIYTIHFLSSGGAGAVDIYDGTSTSGTKVWALTGTDGKTTTLDYGPDGILLPSGCYVDVGSNITSVTVGYSHI